MSTMSIQTIYAEYETSAYIGLITDVVMLYEYVITFKDEVEVIWKRPWTAPSVLLLSVRWVMLLTPILDLTPSTSNEYVLLFVGCQHGSNSTNYSCSIFPVVLNVVTLLGFLQTALFSSLRIHVLSNKNIFLSGLVFVLGMVPFASNLRLDTGIRSTFSPYPFPTCRFTSSTAEREIMILRYVTRTCLMFSDTLVLGVTWIQTFRSWNEARRLKMSTPIMTCLLRDGTWYFVALLALNILQLTLADQPGLTSTFAGAFIITLPPVLTNRFMINLRSLDKSSHNQSSLHASRFSFQNIRISQNVFGNIGEPLEYGEDADEAGRDVEILNAVPDSDVAGGVV